jgi:hypothetical protein
MGWMAFLCELPLVCSYLCGRARKGDIHLVTPKDRVDVTSHLASCRANHLTVVWATA